MSRVVLLLAFQTALIGVPAEGRPVPVDIVLTEGTWPHPHATALIERAANGRDVILLPKDATDDDLRRAVAAYRGRLVKSHEPIRKDERIVVDHRSRRSNDNGERLGVSRQLAHLRSRAEQEVAAARKTIWVSIPESCGHEWCQVEAAD